MEAASYRSKAWRRLCCWIKKRFNRRKFPQVQKKYPWIFYYLGTEHYVLRIYCLNICSVCEFLLGRLTTIRWKQVSPSELQSSWHASPPEWSRLWESILLKAVIYFETICMETINIVARHIYLFVLLSSDQWSILPITLEALLGYKTCLQKEHTKKFAKTPLKRLSGHPSSWLALT